MNKKAVTAAQMAEIDRKAREDYGISQIVLMENAGRCAAEVILAESQSIKNERVAIFCGKGNNGGDGFVVGRYLANESPERLTVYVTDSEGIRPGAAADNYRIIRKMGLDIRPISVFLSSEKVPGEITIGVDAVFGTGFKGELSGEYAVLAKALNSSRAKLYAIDVPSGLNATTGEAAKDGFKAYKTITFGLAKQGFFTADGPEVCGEVMVRNIGFPSALLEEHS